MNIKDFILGYLIGKGDGGGSGVEVEPLTVTENGEYSEEGKAYSPVTVNVAGGASNIVTGSFTAQTGVNTIDLPYSGSGYPVMTIIAVDGGIENTANSGMPNNAIGLWFAAKRDMLSTPHYTGDRFDTGDWTCVLAVYRNNGSIATNASAGLTAVYSAAGPSYYYNSCVTLSNAKTLNYLCAADKPDSAATGYLLTGKKYNYWIIYSE